MPSCRDVALHHAAMVGAARAACGCGGGVSRSEVRSLREEAIHSTRDTLGGPSFATLDPDSALRRTSKAGNILSRLATAARCCLNGA
eukprot:2902842-Prymnesium_polylepis.1